MNKPHKHAVLIHAWADGAEIQGKLASGGWVDSPNPSWFIEQEYRIKPRTVKKVGWVATYRYQSGTTCLYSTMFASEADAKHKCPSAKAIIKVEWEEEEE